MYMNRKTRCVAWAVWWVSQAPAVGEWTSPQRQWTIWSEGFWEGSSCQFSRLVDLSLCSMPVSRYRFSAEKGDESGWIWPRIPVTWWKEWEVQRKSTSIWGLGSGLDIFAIPWLSTLPQMSYRILTAQTLITTGTKKSSQSDLIVFNMVKAELLFANIWDSFDWLKRRKNMI